MRYDTILNLYNLINPYPNRCIIIHLHKHNISLKDILNYNNYSFL